MSNTFWAVLFGSALGMFTVNLATALVEEWQHKRHHRNLDLSTISLFDPRVIKLWEQIEDEECDD